MNNQNTIIKPKPIDRAKQIISEAKKRQAEVRRKIEQKHDQLELERELMGIE